MSASPARRAPPRELSFAGRQLAARVRAARAHGMAAPRSPVPLTRPPTLIESDYAGRLVAIVDRMHRSARHVLDVLPHILRTETAGRLDGWTAGVRHDVDPGRQARDAAERMRAEVEGAFDVHQFERVAAGFGERVSSHQKGEIGRQAKAALGVDVVTLDPKVPPLIRGFAHENVSLIKRLQGTALDHIEALATRAVTSGTRADVVAREIEDRFGIAERHARLIARDQIGKLNGQITAIRHDELGIRSFRWRSMHDVKVRPLHVVLDGQVYSYDKLPAEGLPGTPIACRCLQEPVFDDILAAAGATDDDGGAVSGAVQFASAALAPEAVAAVAETEAADLIAPLRALPEPAGMPEGFSVHVEVDGARVFGDEPKLSHGIPSFRNLSRATYRQHVYVAKPSQLADRRLFGIDTGGDNPTDSRTESILQAWRSSHVLAALEVDVDKNGNYFVADGKHRLWAAAFSGDKPVAIRFRPVELPIERMDPIAARLREVLAKQ